MEPRDYIPDKESTSIDILKTLLLICLCIGLFIGYYYVTSHDEYNSFQNYDTHCRECAQAHNLTCTEHTIFGKGLYGLVQDINTTYVDCTRDPNINKCSICMYVYYP